MLNYAIMTESRVFQKKLFSIGDLAKMTGASIKSLRYYEQLGLLKPAYTNPDTGYRYYKFEQTNIVYIISICIELDIPLKNLTQYITDEVVDYAALLALGKEIAEKKLATIKNGLRYINDAEQKIALLQDKTIGQIYNQQMPERYFYILPCKSFGESDILELAKMYKTIHDQDNVWLEPGIGIEKNGKEIKRFVFIEMPHGTKGKDIKIISRGEYRCLISETSQIENVQSAFGLNGSFIAIETELYAGKSRINKPLHNTTVMIQ